MGATRLAWLSSCISTRCVEAVATYPRNARFSNDVSRLRIGTDIVMHDLARHVVRELSSVIDARQTKRAAALFND
ncbi:hypothetical protein E2R23_29280 [Burkholderia pseudomallei]|uniref:hypothetical protein n=1 Tax=Burkholderia pseudomallei TaxID=28450 RepID=UPI00104DB02E|nr:hypothetical protein EYA82_29090 [Burkholderia pseudomallei]QBL89622.1 hypothetical protein EYA88_28820 [Burkholderia pseudomallei]QBP60154.1 hypothetical protein E2R23_29280 [Burkholderia pseudomallei]